MPFPKQKTKFALKETLLFCLLKEPGRPRMKFRCNLIEEVADGVLGDKLHV